MKWEVHPNQNDTLICELPTHISAGVPVQGTVNGKTLCFCWYARAGRLTVLHELAPDVWMEECLQVESISTEALAGGKSLSLLYRRGGKSYLLNGTVGLAMALRASADATDQRDLVIKSPLTGKIVQVLAQKGKTVHKGQDLFVIEAMKMENRVQAQTKGVVTEVQATVDTGVNVGDVLCKLQRKNTKRG